MDENNLEKWVEIIKKHYTTMRGFHPETYKITFGDIEATARFFYDLGLKRAMEEPDCIYNHAPNNPQITVGTKIRSKTNPDVILSIISNDCHEDEFECSNGSVLSLKQIEKYYDIYNEEKQDFKKQEWDGTEIAPPIDSDVCG